MFFYFISFYISSTLHILYFYFQITGTIVIEIKSNIHDFVVAIAIILNNNVLPAEEATETERNTNGWHGMVQHNLEKKL